MRFKKFLFILFVFFITGCATAPYKPTPKIEPSVPGFYHNIKKGETLWRISKLYSMDLDELARINRIPDAANIELGQLIFIPRQQNKIPDIKYEPGTESDDFVWPLKGKIIVYFGQTFNNMINKGIKIRPYNTREIVASRDGKIIFYSDNFIGFGKTIIIDHHDGFSTVYARNTDVFVRLGDNVRRGQIIAKVGLSSRDKFTYLHFEIRKAHIPKNPLFYLPH